MSTYTATIGLEVHAELNTASKMFCGCKNEPHDAAANEHTCPVCLAHPGTLPTINEAAVAKVLRFGHAVGATVADFSEFDRKNYFYPDIPKAYQISQYAFPLVSGGELAGVALTRVHLEEDTARSQHKEGNSLVDFNRAGVPLMELVTEPVIHDAATASQFARELQLLLRTLDISHANMERGEMRVEANVSVSADTTLGTKVEIKNLNSFKIVEQAIEFEIARQQKLLERGEQVTQETRGWDEAKGVTFTQRKKETAHDYRYFPDPDLPKLQISNHGAFDKSRIQEKNENLPENKRLFYRDLGLTSDQTETILFSQILNPYFAMICELCEEKSLLKLAANYLVTDIQPQLGEGAQVGTLLLPHHFLDLMRMLKDEKINSRVAKDLLAEFALADTDLVAIATERNLLQQSSDTDLAPIVEQVVVEYASVVAEYKAGKEASLQFLVGQGMKLSRGKANPGKLAELLKRSIE